jgi:hypothetical protein
MAYHLPLRERMIQAGAFLNKYKKAHVESKPDTT